MPSFLSQTLFKEKEKGLVKRLECKLYGLRDTSTIRCELIREYFFEAKLEDMKRTPCVFKKQKLIALCYVDHLVLLLDTEQKNNTSQRKVGKHLIIKDLGVLKPFVSLDITWEENAVRHSQKRVIRSLIKQKGMINCKPISTPTNTSFKRSDGDDLKLKQTMKSMNTEEVCYIIVHSCKDPTRHVPGQQLLRNKSTRSRSKGSQRSKKTFKILEKTEY